MNRDSISQQLSELKQLDGIPIARYSTANDGDSLDQESDDEGGGEDGGEDDPPENAVPPKHSVVALMNALVAQSRPSSRATSVATPYDLI